MCETLSLEQRKGKAAVVVREFLEDHADPWNRDSQTPYELARSLVGLKGRPEDYEDVVREAVEEAGENAGESFEGYWETVVDVWDDIVFGAGDNQSLEWAYRMAKETPIPLPTNPRTPLRRTLGSMCWYLADRCHPLPFMLCREAVGRVCNVEPMRVSRAVRWLVEQNIIEPQNGGHYVPKKQCIRYHLKC